MLMNITLSSMMSVDRYVWFRYTSALPAGRHVLVILTHLRIHAEDHDVLPQVPGANHLDDARLLGLVRNSPVQL